MLLVRNQEKSASISANKVQVGNHLETNDIAPLASEQVSSLTGYYGMNSIGEVECAFTATLTTPIAASQRLLFILPEGFRPIENWCVICRLSADGEYAAGHLIVGTSGTVYLRKMTDTTLSTLTTAMGSFKFTARIT